MKDRISTGHPSLAGHEVADGCLVIGGIPLTRLADRVGTTPFYAYDRARITERVRSLRRCLPQDLHLHYAVKANPMPAVVQHLAGLVDGFDVASAGELRIVLDTPIAPENVSFAGPGKTRSELRQALAAGIVLHIESMNEMRLVASLADELGMRPRAALRINPDFELKASGMRMGGGAQQFGIDAERAPKAMADAKSLGVEVVGFHVFAGSQNLNTDIICETQAKIVDLVIRLGASLSAPPRHLNIGGGLGIPYFPKDKPLDLAPVGANLGRLMDRLGGHFPEAAVITELGRFIVGEAGVYVARVVDRKESRGRVFLVTDGGLHHHLAASGNFGQVIRRNYPVVVGNRMAAPADETVSVVGCLCTPLDLVADRVDLPTAQVGDLVVVLQSGAYGLSASPTAFLGHRQPVEVLS